MGDYANASISYEIEYTKELNKIEMVSFFDEGIMPICSGNILVSTLDIYEVENPYWLSDSFIFCKKHFDNLIVKCDIECYIKVNCIGQIEEIGTDFCSRFHATDFNAIIQRKDVHEASQLHKIIFATIGDEFWASLYSSKTIKKKR